jgi:hypothetical protein
MLFVEINSYGIAPPPVDEFTSGKICLKLPVPKLFFSIKYALIPKSMIFEAREKSVDGPFGPSKIGLIIFAGFLIPLEP